MSPLPVKQRSEQGSWLAAEADAYDFPDPDRAEHLISTAAQRIRRLLADEHLRHPGYGWSGGKDSQALRIVCERAAVDECYLAISNLEWPAFLAWATDHMPARCHVVLRSRLDLTWLKANPQMLFPDSQGAARWFSLVQASGRRLYVRGRGLDVVFLGRRLADGNQVAPRGGVGWTYRQEQALIASPLFDWTHEDLLCVLGAHRTPLAPNYRWPRGYRVGTGSWPARQWVGSRANGWDEVTMIDRDVARRAAHAGIPGAREALERCAD